MTPFRAPDGTWWGAEVRMPSHSSACVLFHHPTGETARFNRYAWVNVRAPEASDPRQVLSIPAVAAALNEGELARLFRRSMPVNGDRPGYIDS